MPFTEGLNNNLSNNRIENAIVLFIYVSQVGFIIYLKNLNEGFLKLGK